MTVIANFVIPGDWSDPCIGWVGRYDGEKMHNRWTAATFGVFAVRDGAASSKNADFDFVCVDGICDGAPVENTHSLRLAPCGGAGKAVAVLRFGDKACRDQSASVFSLTGQKIPVVTHRRAFAATMHH
jgi:hypothetical protein